MNVVDDARRNKPWRERVAAVAMLAAGDFRAFPRDGALSVSMTFYMQRPKSHYFTSAKRRGQLKPNAPIFPTGKPDVLKLARSTEDALTGIVWRDDCQTVSLQLAKEYGERPGVHINVTAY